MQLNSLFLLLGLACFALAQQTQLPFPLNETANPNISFRNVGAIFQVSNTGNDSRARLDTLFTLFFGRGGFVEASIVDIEPTTDSLLLKKVYKLRVRQLLEFNDTGDEGFKLRDDPIVQTYFLDSTWDRWTGPFVLSDTEAGFETTTISSLFKLLGKTNVTVSVISNPTDFMFREINFTPLYRGNDTKLALSVRNSIRLHLPYIFFFFFCRFNCRISNTQSIPEPQWKLLLP